jgi:hypothetical protein
MPLFLAAVQTKTTPVPASLATDLVKNLYRTAEIVHLARNSLNDSRQIVLKVDKLREKPLIGKLLPLWSVPVLLSCPRCPSGIFCWICFAGSV